jgi:hypothetical protein
MHANETLAGENVLSYFKHVYANKILKSQSRPWLAGSLWPCLVFSGTIFLK